MTASCPPPPIAPAILDLAPGELAAGTRLVRFHSSGRKALDFHPNLDRAGKPRRMDIAADGSRFNPFPDIAGANIHSLYAGTTEQAAALESVFHDVPHIARPQYPRSKLSDFVLSRFEIKRPLQVLELINPTLRQLPVPGRTESLHEGELIHSDPTNYPVTRLWARLLFLSLPSLQGLAWRPRLGGEGKSYVFFGDRIAIDKDMEQEDDPVRIDSGMGLAMIERIAGQAHIELIHTR